MRRTLLLGCALWWVAAIAAAPPTARPGMRSTVPVFAHVVVVVFENHERDAVVGSTDAPTFNTLAERYAQLTAYHAVAHPSLPNYLALVSGSTNGIGDDCTGCVVSASSLADTLPRHGRTWKTYAEGLPAPGFAGAASGRYAKKHDPFLYFRSVLASRARRERIVPYGQLRADLASARLPSFSLIVPDLCDDMHDCSIRTGDRWLKANVVPMLASPVLRRSVVFVVFDEGTSDVGGGGVIAALVLGPLVRHGAASSTRYSHYSLLRTIEQSWRLPYLGASAKAAPISGIWR